MWHLFLKTKPHVNSLLLIRRDNIVLYRPSNLENKFEDSKVVYSGSPVTSEINDFITKN